MSKYDPLWTWIKDNNERIESKAISNTDRYQSRMGFPDGYL